MRHGRKLIFGCAISTSLMATLACAGYKSTSHSTVNPNSGSGACTAPNQPPNQATNSPFDLTGSIDYSTANGGGNDTQISLSQTDECEFATFAPVTGYLNALVDAKAVIFKYNKSNLTQTVLEETYFGNGEIQSNPYPEIRGITGGPGSVWIIAQGSTCRYKVIGGYWPPAPLPFEGNGAAWTDDLF